jgi:serine/threonine protein phosphatase PrpC
VIRADRGLLAVSDGMGGGAAGATASRAVVAALPSLLERHLGAIPDDDETRNRDALRDAIVELSQEMFRQSAGRPGLDGMGATVVAACLRGLTLYVAHMGDSRAYLLRASVLSRLTTDHSLVQLLLGEGAIGPEEIAHHPLKGRISRHVGMESVVYPDVRSLALTPGDRLLLCTDGLSGMVADDEIGRLLAQAESPASACQKLIAAALAGGGADNVTALVADWTP